MTNRRPRRETETVIDFMNADFAHETGTRGKWAKYLLDAGLSLKRARAIQETMLAAHRIGSVAPLADGVQRYAITEWRPAKDRRSFEPLRNISGAESILYTFLVYVINLPHDQFFSLKRCAECSRFFPDGRKRQYCSDACLRKHNSKKAQERVEKARAKKRFNEVYPKLLKLQKAAAKGTSELELLGKLPGFTPARLADIIKGEVSLKKLAAQIKYKNRRILMEAKL
jgi:hypothetical protein